MNTKSNFCLCCNVLEDIFNIFESHVCEGVGNIDAAATMLKQCFDIKITPESGFSGICGLCMLKLNSALELKKEIIKNTKEIERQLFMQMECLQHTQFDSLPSDDNYLNICNITTELDPKSGILRYVTNDNIELNDNEMLNQKYINENTLCYNDNANNDESVIESSAELTSNVVINNAEFDSNNVKKVYSKKVTSKDTRTDNIPNITLGNDKLNIIIDMRTKETKDSDENNEYFKENTIGGKKHSEMNEIVEDRKNVSLKKTKKVTWKDDELTDSREDTDFETDIEEIINNVGKKKAKKGILKHRNEQLSKNREIAHNNNVEITQSEDIEESNHATLNLFPNKSKSHKDKLFTLAAGQTTCSICHKTFPTSKSLHTHMSGHFARYSCQCGSRFASAAALKQHSAVHLQGPFVCTICDKLFDKINSKNSHMWRVHHTKTPYLCSECGQRFKTFHQRLRHLQKDHGNLEPKYPCPYCDNKYYYAGSRSTHIRLTHLHERQYKCPHCPMAFGKRRGLFNHMATAHDVGEKRHQCLECGKAFYLSSTLRYHIKTHEKAENTGYKCDVCGARFNYKAVLKCHLKCHNDAETTVNAT